MAGEGQARLQQGQRESCPIRGPRQARFFEEEELWNYRRLGAMLGRPTRQDAGVGAPVVEGWP